jgi:N6-adenosine-specific RNA methylase IME4
MKFPDKLYKVIYADPPWDYGNTKNPQGWWGRAEKHYPTMKISEICALPVKKIAAENSYLFLWTTSPFMKKSFQVIEAWGFNFSTVAFVWIKTTKDGLSVRGDGIGRYTLSNAEYCLLARKGRYWRESKSVKQVVMSPKMRHSEKPAEVRNRIAALCGDVAKIELFARDRPESWDVWGYDVADTEEK